MTRADALVLALLLTGLAFSFAAFWGGHEPASELIITHGGDTLGRYPLDIDRVIDVPGRLGISTVRIENGAAAFIASPCRHKLCIRAGKRSRAGDVAACVPNRVAILADGGKAEYDSLIW